LTVIFIGSIRRQSEEWPGPDSAFQAPQEDTTIGPPFCFGLTDPDPARVSWPPAFAYVSLTDIGHVDALLLVL
jgi:hypothetical protein